MQLMPSELNERNRLFWDDVKKDFARTIETNPKVPEEALQDLKDELWRCPFSSVRTLEKTVKEVKAKRELHYTEFRPEFHREFSNKGVNARRPNELTRLIEDIVERRPNISQPQLLADLKERKPILSSWYIRNSTGNKLVSPRSRKVPTPLNGCSKGPGLARRTTAGL